MAIKTPWVKGREVCQHYKYSKHTDGLLMSCTCLHCGHKWRVALCPNGQEKWQW